jgi:hypothetical protein
MVHIFFRKAQIFRLDPGSDELVIEPMSLGSVRRRLSGAALEFERRSADLVLAAEEWQGGR